MRSALHHNLAGIRRLWLRLVQPSYALTEPDQQHQARLLAILLVIIILMGGVWGIILVLFETSRSLLTNVDLIVTLLTLAGLTLAYVLSRTRWYKAGAFLSIGLTTIAIFVISIPQDDPSEVSLQAYLLLPVILSSLLFSARITASLIALHAAGILLMGALLPDTPINMQWVGYILVVSWVIMLAGRYRNIVEHARSAQLAANEKNYRLLFERNLAAVYSTTLDGRILDCNAAFVRLVGCESVAEVRNQPVTMFYANPEARAVFIQRLQQHGTLTNVELCLHRQDGSLVWIHEEINLVQEPGSEPHIQSTAIDITERKRTEEALFFAQARSNAILQAMPDLLFVLDHEGRHLRVDAYDTSLLVVPADQLIGRRLHDVLPAPTAERIYDQLMLVLNTGQVQPVEYWLDLPDGRHEMDGRLAPISPGEVLLISRDVTAHKQTLRALRRRDAILEVLAFVDENLLAAHDMEAALPDLLGHLGTAIGVSRVYIFENLTAPDGTLCTSQRHEWTAPGQMPQIDNPELQKRPYETEGFGRWVPLLSAGQPIYGLVRDLPEQERSQLKKEDILSILIVPIFSGDRWWGFMGFDDCEQERVWQPVEIEALRSAAATLGAAIARQASELAERNQRVLSEALRDTAAALNSTLDIDEVMDRILTNIGQVVPHDAANIMLLHNRVAQVERYRNYIFRDADISAALDLRFPLNDTPNLLTMFESGNPLIIPDTREYPHWKQNQSAPWVRSWIGTPIKQDNRVIGFINLDSAQPNFFTDEHSRHLQIFADQAATAVHNARLYDEIIRYADELAMLYRGTSYLVTAALHIQDIGKMGQQVAEVIVQEFDKPDCGIMLIDTIAGKFVRLARAGSYGVQAEQTLHLEGPGLVPAAARTAQPIYAPDVTTDPRYAPTDTRTRSEMAVPLLTARGVIGVMDLQSPEPDAFNDSERRVLVAFAERVAAALENRLLDNEIRHYMDDLEQRVQERTIDLSVRNAVAATLSSSLDMHEMLSGVLQTTVEQLNVLGGGIYLLADDSSSLDLAAWWGVSPEILSRVTGITSQAYLALLDRVPLGLPSGNTNATVRAETGITAVLSVPIWRQEQVQGVITLVDNRVRPWLNDETRMLDAIGRQIGVALANAHLYSEAVRGEAHIRTILRSVADGLLVFDQDANPILLNPAAEALFAFFPAAHGGVLRAAQWLWAWLQSQIGDNGEPASVEFELPSEPFSGPGIDTRPCQSHQCSSAAYIDSKWPCWLQVPGLSAADVQQCPVYQRLPRRTLQAHYAQVRDAEEAILGTVIVLHDVTYYRELDTLKGRFVSTVSHELRTPLSAVLLQISTLTKYYHRFPDNERLEILTDIYQQAHILRELIEDILELSRFDAKRAVPHKREFDLAYQCLDIVNNLRPMVYDKHLTIDTSQCLPPCPIEADSNQTARIIRNLVSNAIKYTPEKGHISVRLETSDHEIRLSVTDTGVGVRPEDQLYIFDRFFRAEESSQLAPGSGLGLSITKELVELHGGRIELDSAPGRGSTFTVILPTATRGATGHTLASDTQVADRVSFPSRSPAPTVD